ncbi:Gp37 family protein [Allorhizobium sp. BGMRC 0089]|uniref:Gp37 family protein n=1 Tax=Allorhizobium sonneratiae TaxID=2934936 RepID=UPI002034382D|nr:Gp37 family protein [Allorhizobium sonneratiae]MCM2291090.1 Gp37 family protein [Allorhizobium sonneratiae]
METSLRTVRLSSIIEQVEDALLTVLKENVSGQCKVDAFPNNPALYDFDGLPAALLIHYTGSRFAPAKGPANTTQARAMEFSLVLLVRSLRGEGGAYAHLDDIRLAIQGRSFAGAGPAALARDQLNEEKDGVWRWEIRVSLPIPAVARNYQPPAPLMRPGFSTP